MLTALARFLVVQKLMIRSSTPVTVMG